MRAEAVRASGHASSSADAGAAARTCPRLTPYGIGHAATLALYDELALAPKPGLVTLLDSGSHTDMDARTFVRSLFSLRGYFVQIAELGAAGAGFAALERCGIAAEQRMLAATGGVNTHRGAVFSLGLLCAAAGAVAGSGAPFSAGLLRQTLRQHWGDALQARARRPSALPGGMAAQRYGLRSASEEAALGFPVLFETAWPVLQDGLHQGLAREQALLDTLFHAMAVLDDSNLAHRGGLAGLAFARQAARSFLQAGGAAAPGAAALARQIGQAFVARRLSPGGAADTLAAACLLGRLLAMAAG